MHKGRAYNNTYKKGLPQTHLVLYAGLFIMLFLIAYGFPITGDDWGRLAAAPISFAGIIESMQRQWTYLNGRVLGNITGLIFAGFKVLRALVKAGIILGMIVMICKNSKIKSASLILLAFFYTFALPYEIFRQAYPWTAGFFNFVPAVLPILIYIYFIRNLFDDTDVVDSKIMISTSFILAFGAQLFMENITLYVMIMSAVTVFWHRVRHRKFSFITMGFFAGSILGAIVMFSSPVYRTITDNTDTYRTLSLSFFDLLQAGRANYHIVSSYVLGTNYVLLFSLAILSLYIVYCSDTSRDFRVNILKKVNLVLMVLLPAYFWISTALLPQTFQIQHTRVYLIIDIIAYGLFFVSFSSVLYYFVQNKSCRNRCFFFLFSVVVVVFPLLLVAPIGPRCFYISYIFMLVIVFNLFEYVQETYPFNSQLLRIPIITLVLCMFGFYSFIFFQNGSIETIRNQYVEEQMAKNKTIIYAPQFPHSQYLHEPYGWKIGYKYHYNQIGDIEFHFLPYREWLVKSELESF